MARHPVLGAWLGAFALVLAVGASLPLLADSPASSPPLPDVSSQNLLPHSLFAACQENNDFRCEAYLAAAAALQSLPPPLGVAQLRQWALEDTRNNSLRSRYLCVMLFASKPGRAFVAPYSDILTVVDGVPFMQLFAGWAGRGPSKPIVDFDYCYAHADWTSFHYHSANPVQLQSALQDMLALPPRPGYNPGRAFYERQIKAPPSPPSSAGAP
jgi:hypothetical protein